MAKIKFLCRWFLSFQQLLNKISELVYSPRGFLLLAYDKKKYRPALGKFLMNLDTWEKEHNDIREIEVSLEIRYKDRSLDQNALMWALYEIEAAEQNGGIVGTREQMVDKMELYEADLENWGERDQVTTIIGRLHYYLTKYRIVRYQCQYGMFLKIGVEEKKMLMSLDPKSEIVLQTTRGTSDYNTVEMARHIDGIFNRLSETVGISDTGQLSLYKKDHDKFKKKHGITAQFNDSSVLEMEE